MRALGQVLDDVLAELAVDEDLRVVRGVVAKAHVRDALHQPDEDIPCVGLRLARHVYSHVHDA